MLRDNRNFLILGKSKAFVSEMEISPRMLHDEWGEYDTELEVPINQENISVIQDLRYYVNGRQDYRGHPDSITLKYDDVYIVGRCGFESIRKVENWPRFSYRDILCTSEYVSDIEFQRYDAIEMRLKVYGQTVYAPSKKELERFIYDLDIDPNTNQSQIMAKIYIDYVTNDEDKVSMKLRYNV